MSGIRFKGECVSRQDILDALRKFDGKYPETNDFTGREDAPRRRGLKGWLDNCTFKYAIRHKGKLYPPKYVLSKATGVPRCAFGGGSQTNAAFEGLGFDVIDKRKAISEQQGRLQKQTTI